MSTNVDISSGRSLIKASSAVHHWFHHDGALTHLMSSVPMGGHTYEYSDVLIIKIRMYIYSNLYIYTDTYAHITKKIDIYRSKNVLDSGLLLKLGIFRLTIGKCRLYFPNRSNSRDSKCRPC